MSSVQELRFAPATSDRFEEEEEAKRNRTTRAASWRATTTPEGRQYFYNATTGEMRWESPVDGYAAGTTTAGLNVGTPLRVFSNSHQCWCDGYVERISRTPVGGTLFTVAFKPPLAHNAAEWVKKELPAGHKDLWCATGCGSQPQPPPQAAPPAPPTRPCHPAGFQDTALPKEFTPEEQAAYDELFARARSSRAVGEAPSAGLGPEQSAEFLRYSGLPNRALKEVWQASNPELKAELGLREFRTVCRLVAHCQALLASEDEAARRLVKAGGGALRCHLRSAGCVANPPPRLPDFKQTDGG